MDQREARIVGLKRALRHWKRRAQAPGSKRKGGWGVENAFTSRPEVPSPRRASRAVPTPTLDQVPRSWAPAAWDAGLTPPGLGREAASPPIPGPTSTTSASSTLGLDLGLQNFIDSMATAPRFTPAPALTFGARDIIHTWSEANTPPMTDGLTRRSRVQELQNLVEREYLRGETLPFTLEQALRGPQAR